MPPARFVDAVDTQSRIVRALDALLDGEIDLALLILADLEVDLAAAAAEIS
jgi:hypothetical protein